MPWRRLVRPSWPVPAKAKGIHGAAGSVTWGEVFEVIKRGCRASGLRQPYQDAYADWCAWAHAGGYNPGDADWTNRGLSRSTGEDQA